MAANQVGTGQRGWAYRLFTEHPRSVGMTWTSHGVGALQIGVRLVGAGCAAIIHAVVPGVFSDTAGRTVARIYDHIQQRKAKSANPENWPDYEI